MDYSKITELDLSNKGLANLPDLSLYTNLKILICSYNKITSLDNLPPTIIELNCFNNLISRIDNFPLTLTYLDCRNNNITSLDNILLTLTELMCAGNPLQYDFEPTLENIRKHNKP